MDSKQLALQVEVIRHIDGSQPGWVECKFTDAWNQDWYFMEKAPVVSQEDLHAHSNYPKIGFIACEIVKQFHDENNRELVTIDTTKPWGIETLNGEHLFDVPHNQLIHI